MFLELCRLNIFKTIQTILKTSHFKLELIVLRDSQQSMKNSIEGADSLRIMKVTTEIELNVL
ncbi:CLUMA_CG000758, isoform A [Clunio marinus]|uniref:CLUMA_CG000758, isoform A n=1 Tax=Clunio marinus TaxID=568069 RepID=A0A1J1HFY9_9DIPT|nr:CLUMA_CG000758, isoform A [Clunio marinus]